MNPGKKLVTLLPNVKTSLPPPTYCLDKNGQLQIIKTPFIDERMHNNYSKKIIYQNQNYTVAPPIPNSSSPILYVNKIKNIGFSSFQDCQNDLRQVCKSKFFKK